MANNRKTTYVFDTVLKTITLTGYSGLLVENINYIRNITTNQLIYQIVNSTTIPTVTGGLVIDLTAFTLTGMSNTDKLEIEINEAGGGTSDATAALQTSGNISLASIDTKLTDALTNAQLRATAVPVSGTVAISNPTANPETGLAKDAKLDTLIAKDFATQTTLALIKAKTDNLDVLLSTRTKPSDTQPVSGTFFQATQPVSGAFFQATQPISASTLPLPTGAAIAANQQTDALTNTQLRATAVPISGTVAVTDVTNPVKIERANLAQSATAATGVALTVTLPAVASQFHNITMIEITAYSTLARVGGATPVIVTTTNLNSTAFTFSSAGAVGATDVKMYVPTLPIKSQTVNTATTIVCPATTSIIWRVNVYYNTSV